MHQSPEPEPANADTRPASGPLLLAAADAAGGEAPPGFDVPIEALLDRLGERRHARR